MSTNAPNPLPKLTEEQQAAFRKTLEGMRFPAPPPKAPIRITITKEWGR